MRHAMFLIAAILRITLGLLRAAGSFLRGIVEANQRIDDMKWSHLDNLDNWARYARG